MSDLTYIVHLWREFSEEEKRLIGGNGIQGYVKLCEEDKSGHSWTLVNVKGASRVDKSQANILVGCISPLWNKRMIEVETGEFEMFTFLPLPDKTYSMWPDAFRLVPVED